ncbi:MAG: hypothetical protein GY765_43420, partial [bacterium]|nr:hypothetical protein [bacterium]
MRVLALLLILLVVPINAQTKRTTPGTDSRAAEKKIRGLIKHMTEIQDRDPRKCIKLGKDALEYLKSVDKKQNLL